MNDENLKRTEKNREVELIRSEISSVLWNVWDPIGMKENGGPRDEYDAYVNGVYAKPRTNSSDTEIANHLLVIVQEQMGYEDAKLEEMVSTVHELRKISL